MGQGVVPRDRAQRRAEAYALSDKHLSESFNLGEGDLEHALELMRRHDTLGATLALAEDYGRSAQRALDLFPQGPERQALSDIIRFCIARAR